MSHRLKILISALSLLSGYSLPLIAKAETTPGAAWIEPKSGMQFAWVPSGCFSMGGDESIDGQPIHKVCVKGFWIGRYEVTQAQFQFVMGNNPSNSKADNKPVESVNLDDVSSFVEELSFTTGTKFRLPSEAEWEYACRAGGAHEKYCGGGGRPDRMAWYESNSGKETHPIGQLAANDWGVYDMSGNVWEITQDCWNDSYIGAPNDGSAWKTGDCGRRVLRGGSWLNIPTFLRAADRVSFDTGNSYLNVGMRLARSAP